MASPEKPDIFVIGTASLDVLHLPDGRTETAAGGAGLYTALAAGKAGVAAGLFAPRPHPMPPALQTVAKHLPWIGPAISPNELPRLEIEHHGGGIATLKDASWGAEAQLRPNAMAAEIVQSGMVHIAALSTAQRQLDFLYQLKQADPPPRISVGTYGRLVYNDRDRVRELLALADLFFMNENEANGLFGKAHNAQTRANALLFVTLGEAGALIIEGTQVTHVPGQPAQEVDPTGAGDTFCGATLAALSRGESPVSAAQFGVVLAAKTVSAIGPTALLPNA